MKKSKSGYLNKIIIYQMPLFERIMVVLSALVLTALPILGLTLPLYENKKELMLCIVILFVAILYCV